MTVPDWAGPAYSPLWGAGDALQLNIPGGADWSVPFRVFDTDGVSPLAVDAPVLEMRRDRAVDSQLVAHFDTTGLAQGLITVQGPGDWILSMGSAQTSQLPTGRGFWDCFGSVAGVLTPIASGIVTVRPRVTASPGSGLPIPPTQLPPPPQPVTVEAKPTPINIAFPAGDDYYLDLTLSDEGAPVDLTGASAEAWVRLGTQVLAHFAVTIEDNVLHLHLDDAETAVLPVHCEWECQLTRGGDLSTIASGMVSVT